MSRPDRTDSLQTSTAGVEAPRQAGHASGRAAAGAGRSSADFYSDVLGEGADDDPLAYEKESAAARPPPASGPGYESLPYMTPSTTTTGAHAFPSPYDPHSPGPQHFPAHSIDLSDGDGHSRLADAASYTSRARLRSDNSRPGFDRVHTDRSQSQSRDGHPPNPVYPPGEPYGSPPVPRVHIDPSQIHPTHHLRTGANGSSRASPNPGKHETLSEKVFRSGYSTPPALSRGSTGDLLTPGGPYQNISAQSSSANMVFAEGDFLPQSKASRACMKLFASNIVIRWAVFILPVMALLWIPGIIGVTAAKDARVWGVKLIYWSCWLTVWWGGWWVGLAFAKIAPGLLHHTVGAVLPFLDPWIGHLGNMQLSMTAFIWSLLSWILFNILITRNQPAGQTAANGNGRVLHLMIQGLFGILVSCGILAVEKLVIQMIAADFHRKSYQDRILEQKAAISVLTTLYTHSHDMGRSDTLGSPELTKQRPAHLIKSALKGVRNVAAASTTVFGTVASEIAGERLGSLQPNAPETMVTTALASGNKTRQLARRIFFSYCPKGSHALVVDDIARYFSSHEAAEAAFKIFDADENGDLELTELEMACLDLHRDRLSLASSMKDLDSAVGRLDAILVFIWMIIATLIIVALLDVSFQTMIASAGTLILGLSWLIGATAQEVLASIIFLFIKHPYDVGDRVDIDTGTYIVREMHLLYTVFRQTDGKIAQMPHSVLNTKTVINIRRSGPITETFSWNVDFGTSFEKIEQFRLRMLEFLEAERRDFFPSIEISIDDFADQAKLSLKTDIKYKSNWQNGTLKAQRRNKYICAAKLALAELEIWGPAGAGNPNPPPAPQLVQMVNEASPISPLSPKKESTASAAQDAARINKLRFGGRDAALRDESGDIFHGRDRRRVSQGARRASIPPTANVAQAAQMVEAQRAGAQLRSSGSRRGADDLELQQRGS